MERGPGYSLPQLLVANVIAWAVFLLIPFVVGKTFVGHGAEIYTFFSLLGLGFSAGSILDFSLDRL
ncbi:MAG: hypothetical protein JW941_00275 [Candidatus Coatesbacteria bacterium]|nr:hypothetical protein [Candidatus Coatesbacteria bacterium]